MYFKQLFEPKLAQNSYLIGCQETGEAFVIDPMRDIERYSTEAEQASLKIVAATDTHIHADYLSRYAVKVLYDSLKEFQRLPGYLQLWPGHGAGSACGKALGAIPISTVGYEVQFNLALQALREENFFIDYILDGQPEPPAYFSRMKTELRSGPAILGKLPQPEHLDYQLLFQIAGNKSAELIDTRDWEDFRKGHVPGALFSPLNKAFNTIAGCYLTTELPIYLVIEKQNLTEAILDLIRIGLDNIAGYFTPEDLEKYAEYGGELLQTKEIDAAQLKKRLSENSVFLLDVRRAAELKETGYIRGAYNIAHTRLKYRIYDLPPDKSIMVQSRSGERSK